MKVATLEDEVFGCFFFSVCSYTSNMGSIGPLHMGRFFFLFKKTLH
jgi:hypothetical protein